VFSTSNGLQRAMAVVLAGTLGGEKGEWLCEIQITCLPHPIDFFSIVVPLDLNHDLPPHLSFSQTKKCPPRICLTVPLALISVQPTRMFSLLNDTTRRVLRLASSCVGVWQNDRVEIIANDR